MDQSDGCVASKPDSDSQEYGGSQEGPATQPVSAALSLSSYDDSLEGSQEEMNPTWGVLYPMRDKWKAVRLIDDTNTFGRSGSNTFSIGEDQAGTRINAISKVHFVIKRNADGVVIVDKSSNGTFVNKKLVGKNKTRYLDHNATIALSDPNVTSYVYMNLRGDFQRDYPKALREKYVVSKDVGSGAYGVVKLAFKVTGTSSPDNPQRVAIKKVDKRKIPLNKGAASDVLNEVRILRAVDHPCVIRLEDVIDTDNFLYIILEFADGGELFDKIVSKTRLNEQESKLMFYQLASAIEYLHSKNVAHRDLKPENILLCSSDESRPLVKITDLGLSKLVDLESNLKTFCGTPQYLAPEVLMSRVRGDGSYGFEIDNWSLGVILYIMISGCPPFHPDRPDKPLIRQVCDGDYSFPASKWNTITPEAVDLVKKLMTVSKSRRLTARQALEHPWLNDPDVKTKAEELMAWSKSMMPDREALGEMFMGPPQSLVQEPNENNKSTNEPPSKKICLENIHS